MFPILYSSITEGTVPTDYGVGVLSDCLECKVKEARNGEYELTMIYPANGIHASDIAPNAFVMAKPNMTDSNQIFRIYKVGKTINGRFEVNAQHITYDLSGKVISSGSASNITVACMRLQNKAGSFAINSDKSMSGNFKITEPSSVRSWFGGKEGSILDVYGPGEWEYDNFRASFLASRGSDRGVTIRYGKNLTDLSQTLDMTNLASAIIPYYKAQDGTITVGSAVSTGLVGITRELAVDFSSSVDPEDATPILVQLAVLATAYVSNNNFTTIKSSIKLDFVQSGELSETVNLCDTVHIYFEPLGITATAKCIETVWDVLEGRYTSTTFGDPKTNIADTIVATQKAVEEKPSTTMMERAIKESSDLITGNLGGYVVMHDSNGDGEPDEILIMDTDDISTATSVWRWNKQGMGFSPNGYAGPYNAVAIDMLGRIVADAITTGTLNADLIKAGTISDVAGNSTIDMLNGAAKMKDFEAKNSLKLISNADVTKMALQHNVGAGVNMTFFNENGEDCGGWTCDGDGGRLLCSKNGDARADLKVSANGSGQLLLFDAGSNECEISLNDNNNYPDVDMTVTPSGGRVDVNNGGYIYGSLRVYNSGGVLDLYDSQYLNIQCLGRTGNITCVSLTQTSSRKVKENIKPMEDYKKILDLDAVSFDFKNKNRGTDKRGFIAEDVAKVLPNLVTPESEKLPASLDYLGMIPYLQAVIKDQEKRIQALEDKLKNK